MVKTNKIWTYSDCAEYLAQRGFDPIEDPGRFGFRYGSKTDAGRALKFGKDWFPAPLAIIFPYYKLDGITPTGYVGARCIGPIEPVPGGDVIKFWTPKGINEVYFPPRKDWNDIPPDTDVEIHESILKCLAATKLGAWAIAINGCHGWSSKGKTKNGLAKGFDQLPWVGKRLRPVLVLDSNGTPGLKESKPGPLQAREKFTALAHARLGVDLWHKYMPACPSDDGENWGFDDYAARDPEGAARMVAAEPVRFSIPENEDIFAHLDENLVIVQEEGRIYETFPPFKGYSKETLANVSYNHLQVRAAGPNGVPRMVPAINVWTTREESPRVRRVLYMPGEDRRMLPNEWFNIWQGMGVEPMDGDIRPLTDHLRNVLPEEEVQYLLDLWSYPLQNLGAKVSVCPVLEGDPGTGKTLIVELLTRIYGKNINAVRVDNDQMRDKWSEFLGKVQFVSYEEVIRPDARSNSSAELVLQRLKKYITEDEISIKQRFMDDRTVANHANFLITTNHIDALKLEKGDRRFSVHRFRPRVPWSRRQWGELADWIMHGPGPALFYGAALQRDLRKFDPYAPAMMTEGKQEMEYASLTPRAQFIMDNRDDLPLVGTSKLYEKAYQNMTDMNYTSTSNESMKMGAVLGKELRMQKVGSERFKAEGSDKDTWWDISPDKRYSTKEAAVEYLKNKPWDEYDRKRKFDKPGHLRAVK